MNSAYDDLQAALKAFRAAWRRHAGLAGGLLSAGVAAGGLLAAVALDNWLCFGVAGRMVLSALLWAAVAASVFGLAVRAALRPRTDDFLAVLAERSEPDLHNALVNAVQLGRGEGPGSPRIVARVVDDAARAAQRLDFNRSLDRRHMRRSAGLAGLCVLALAVYGLAFTGRFANGLARICLPTAEIAPYTATRILPGSVQPGSVRVPEGAPVRFAARVAGVIPDAAHLHRRTGERDWYAVAMRRDPAQPDRFSFEESAVHRSFEYRVTAGDGRSGVYRVEAVARPRPEGLTWTITPPAYTGEPTRRDEASGGDLAGLAGSHADLSLRASKPLQEALLLTDAGQVIPLRRADEARAWGGTVALWDRQSDVSVELHGSLLRAPLTYQVRMRDTDGYENRDPLWHTVALVEDRPPKPVISKPGRNLQVPLEDAGAVDLVVEARDDYGIGEVAIVYRVNDEGDVRTLAKIPHAQTLARETRDEYRWDLQECGLGPGDAVQYWAVALDRNTVSGPGRGESRKFSLFILTPRQSAVREEMRAMDFEQALMELVRLQSLNRAETEAGLAFPPLVTRQARIRGLTGRLARAIEESRLSLATVTAALDALYADDMAEAVRLLERGADEENPVRAEAFRSRSLPVQDGIVEELQRLLARLQRNEQAREALKRLREKDRPAYRSITNRLAEVVKDLDRMVVEKEQLVEAFEKLPKAPAEEFNEETVEALEEMEEFTRNWLQWAKDTVDNLTKLPTGFVDDFGLRPDVKRLWEEIEKAAARRATVKLEVALEDLGATLATEMMEDLDMWLPDTPDFRQWLMEEPLGNRPMDIPEMPLPATLRDMMGELLQEAEEFDRTADDITSGWGDNLAQAGWQVDDGPISSFSASGVTGNDLPNTQELTGRAGDGRRGRSSGQMVGDTSRALAGRKTPARVTAERYEPGVLKQEGQADPAGATGGGKKAGVGPRGLQGGTPPDFVRDMERLQRMQAGVREKTERIARELDLLGVTAWRLDESIRLMKSVEDDLRDFRYESAIPKRRIALHLLDDALTGEGEQIGVYLSRARHLPAALREELVQSADEPLPPGYGDLVKRYYRRLSEAGE